MNSQTLKLLKRVAQTGGATLLSRVLGVVRDILLARTLGSSIYADAIFVAMTIPNMFRALCTESALLPASVPICVDLLRRYPQQRSATLWSAEVSAYLGLAVGWLSLILLLVVCLGQLAAGWIVTMIAPGFLDHPDKFALTVQALQIMFPYLLTITLTTFLGSILHVYHRFVMFAFSAAWVNAGLIGCMVLLNSSELLPTQVVSGGLLLGGLLQLAVVVCWLWWLGLLPSPQLTNRTRSGKEAQKSLKKLIHRVAHLGGGNAFRQLASLAQVFFASFLMTGSVTWLYYANRFVQLPIGIFAIALSNVVLPRFAELVQKKDTLGFKQTADFALRLVFWVGLPCALALYVLAAPLIATFFQYGQFGSQDVMKTASVLRVYAVGLVFMTLQIVLSQMLISLGHTRLMLKMSALSCGVEIALSAALVPFLDHVALAWSRSLTACFVALFYLAYLVMRKKIGFSAKWLSLVLRVLAASLLAFAAASLLVEALPWRFDAASFMQRFWMLGLLGTVFISTYITAFLAFGGRLSQLELAR